MVDFVARTAERRAGVGESVEAAALGAGAAAVGILVVTFALRDHLHLLLVLGRWPDENDLRVLRAERGKQTHGLTETPSAVAAPADVVAAPARHRPGPVALVGGALVAL